MTDRSVLCTCLLIINISKKSKCIYTLDYCVIDFEHQVFFKVQNMMCLAFDTSNSSLFVDYKILTIYSLLFTCTIILSLMQHIQ